MKRLGGHPPQLHVIPVTQAGIKPITESSHGPTRCLAMVGEPKDDLTGKAPSRAVDHSADSPVTQRFVTLEHPTHKGGETLLFENSNEVPEYLRRENAC